MFGSSTRSPKYSYPSTLNVSNFEVYIFQFSFTLAVNHNNKMFVIKKHSFHMQDPPINCVPNTFIGQHLLPSFLVGVYQCSYLFFFFTVFLTYQNVLHFFSRPLLPFVKTDKNSLLLPSLQQSETIVPRSIKHMLLISFNYYNK